jgi:hypothetical protein
MSTSRKARILRERARPVSETASLIAEGLEAVAGALCQFAAGMHTTSKGDQRDFAAVLFSDVQQRFEDVNRKLDPKRQEELETYITKLCQGKK